MEEIDEYMSLTDQLIEHPIVGWEDFITVNLSKIKRIDGILERKDFCNYYPRNNEMFTAFRLCPLSDVKVVILGLNPYPGKYSDGKTQAVGMSFSGRKDYGIPKSLANIIKELKKTVDNFEDPEHGWLGSWAEQGVLMLNTSLTYHINDKELSTTQKGYWSPFIKAVFGAIKIQNPNVIVMLWGRDAQKYAGCFGTSAVEMLAPHPSPINTSSSFVGCKHFRRCNKILVKRGEDEINWNIV